MSSLSNPEKFAEMKSVESWIINSKAVDKYGN